VWWPARAAPSVSRMPLLDHATYLAHIADESARFRDVLATCDPAARVPSCPDWDAADLLWHLTGVQDFWATIVRQRPVGPDDYQEPERPGGYADLLAMYDDHSRGLVAALEAASPEDEAWTWSLQPGHQSVAFILRRQAHEALIHRLDAELAAGAVTDLGPRLAADGVLEVLEVMYGGCPPWGTFTPGEGLVRIDATDTGDSFWVRLGSFDGTDPRSGTTYTDEPDLDVVTAPGADTEPDVVVDGPAGALDAWLWHRGGDTEISVAGDGAVHARFVEVVSQSID
jgi:uncharacterized protein (TIGR03083 family)